MSDSVKWVMDAFVKLVVTVALAISGWSLVKTIDHDARIQVVEQTRFTQQNGHDLEVQMRAEIRESVDEIKNCLNRIQRDQPCD